MKSISHVGLLQHENGLIVFAGQNWLTLIWYFAMSSAYAIASTRALSSIRTILSGEFMRIIESSSDPEGPEELMPDIVTDRADPDLIHIRNGLDIQVLVLWLR